MGWHTPCSTLSWYPGELWSTTTGTLTLTDEGDDVFTVTAEDLAMEHFLTGDTGTASFQLLAEHCDL